MHNFNVLSLIGTIALSRWVQFGASLATAGTLAIVPTALKWGNEATLYSTLAGLGLTSIGYVRSRGLQQELELSVHLNRTDHRMQMESVTFELDAQRAKYRRAINIIEGGYNTDDAVGMLGQMARDLRQLNDVSAFMVSGQLPAGELPASSVLPPEDLAQTIAAASGDENNILFVGKSRSGKTSLMVNAMAQKTGKHDGNLDWFVFNGKPERDNDWGGLTDSQTDYWEVNSQEKASDMLSQFKTCVQTLQSWQSSKAQHYPMFIASDEVNNQRILLEDSACKVFDKLIALYATQCMSEQSGLWLASHSHNVEDIGLNRKLQQSFQLVALGRNGKYESIAAVLDDVLIIRDKDSRERLKAQLQQYIVSGENGAIAFTNLGGDARLVQLPHYSKDVRVQRNALNQSTDEILSAESEVSQLERLWGKSASHPIEEFYHQSGADLINFFANDELSDRQRQLLEWSSGKGWLSPSKIQAELWSYRTITAAEILADFKVLRAAGYGELRSKYNTVQWNRDENQNS